MELWKATEGFQFSENKKKIYIGSDNSHNEKTISRAAGTNGYLTKTAHQREQELFYLVKRIFFFVQLKQKKSEFEWRRRVILFWYSIKSKCFSLFNACNWSEFRFGSVNAIRKRNVHNIERIVVEPMKNCIKTREEWNWANKQECDFYGF